MKEAMNAFEPQVRLYHVQRLHSKLIYLARIKGVLTDIFDDTDIYTIDIVLSELVLNLRCIANIDDPKEQIAFDNYLKAIEQAIFVTTKYRITDIEKIRSSFCFMSGAFAKFRKIYSGKQLNFCLNEYNRVVNPMYRLDYIYIKNTYNNNIFRPR